MLKTVRQFLGGEVAQVAAPVATPPMSPDTQDKGPRFEALKPRPKHDLSGPLSPELQAVANNEPSPAQKRAAQAAFNREHNPKSGIVLIETPRTPQLAPAGMIVAIIAKASAPLASPDEIAKLRELQQRHDRLSKKLHTEFGYDRLLELVKSRRRGAVAEALDADVALPAISSSASIREAFLMAKEKLRADMKVVVLEALPLARAIIERFESLAGQVADTEEASERKRAESWGMSYAPSELVALIRDAAPRLLADLPSSVGHVRHSTSPRHMLRGIVQI
jgi:hypothetical protein